MSQTLGPDDHVFVLPGLELLESGGSLIAVRRATTTRLDGVSARALRALLDAVEADARVTHICERFGANGAARVPPVLESLLGTVLTADPRDVRDVARVIAPVAGTSRATARAPEEPVLTSELARRDVRVVGDGTLAEVLGAALGAAGLRTVMPVGLGALTLEAAAVDLAPPDATETARLVYSATAHATDHGLDVARLAAELRGADLAIAAPTGVSMRTLGDVEAACLRAGVPCLFVVARHDAIECGPLLVDASTAGPVCARLAIDLGPHPDPDEARQIAPLLRTLDDADLPLGRLGEVADRVVDEAVAALSGAGKPALIGGVVRIGDERSRTIVPIARAARVPADAPDAEPAASTPALDRARAQRDLAALRRERGASLHYLVQRPRSEIRSVGILGGGTAGYLTALALAAWRPDVAVTVIESSKIPVIGVGEATTPDMPHFLHHVLGFDVADFYARVRPTWKLGIRFEWGPEQPPYFNYPFDDGRALEARLHDGHINDATMLSVLMSESKGLLVRAGDGVASLLGEHPYAYHLDNAPFVAFLAEAAHERGIAHVDAVIEDVELAADGERVAALVDDDGRRHAFDLYVDCSGFGARLIEKALGSPFESYASSLFTDRAVVVTAPHDGLVKPYTTATTMRHGWCWNIPQVHEDHLGYVYSSAFCSDEEALDELRARVPRASDPWTVRFRSGRHAHFARGNVVAIGNAYGFVEPLESTALHLVVHEIQQLLKHFPSFADERATFDELNRDVGALWDYYRWFLAVHYRFNGRLDTPFWRACRADVDVSGAQRFLDLFTSNAPLGYRQLGDLGGAGDSFVLNNFGYDCLLFGMDVPARLGPARESEARHRRKVETFRAIASRALPQAECLRILTDERPDLLRAHVDDPDGWLGAMRSRTLTFAPAVAG